MDKIVRKGSGFALGDHIQEFMPEQLKYNLGDADFISAPVLFDDHWFCYAIETRSMRFYALDSLVDSVTFNALQMDETLKQQSMEPKHYARRKMSKGFKETFRHKNKMATHCVSLINVFLGFRDEKVFSFNALISLKASIKKYSIELLLA